MPEVVLYLSPFLSTPSGFVQGLVTWEEWGLSATTKPLSFQELGGTSWLGLGGHLWPELMHLRGTVYSAIAYVLTVLGVAAIIAAWFSRPSLERLLEAGRSKRTVAMAGVLNIALGGLSLQGGLLQHGNATLATITAATWITAGLISLWRVSQANTGRQANSR